MNLQKALRKQEEEKWRALRSVTEGRERVMASAATAALARLKTAGFPGAQQRVDGKRRTRAAWFLCETAVKRPLWDDSSPTTRTWYLFSTGQVLHEHNGSHLLSLDPDHIVAALERLGR